MRTELAVIALAALASAPSRADASSCVPGFDYAIFAKNKIHIQGNAGTDSWNSSMGSYDSTNSCSDADVGTNSTSAGAGYIKSASTDVCGDAFCGVGCTPSSVFTGNGNIHGTQNEQTSNQSLPDITLPSGLTAASPFNLTFKHTAADLPADREYGDVSCQQGSITLHAGTYLLKSLTLTSNCELKLSDSTKQTEVYFTSSLDLHGGAVANSTGVPGNLVFYGGPSATSVDLQGGTGAYFAVYAPSAACEVQGNASIFGAVVCDSAHFQGNAHIHYDTALQSIAGGGFTCPANETSRATPIVTTFSGESAIVQGT
jgi:hypothetical protein